MSHNTNSGAPNPVESPRSVATEQREMRAPLHSSLHRPVTHGQISYDHTNATKNYADTLSGEFSIKVNKQYFNFASAHFLIFPDGRREPLHGHNYKVSVEAHSPALFSDMVFDFLDIKPLVREICDELDHRLLLPKENEHLTINHQFNSRGHSIIQVTTADGFEWQFPEEDVLLLPIPNTSSERLAQYLARTLAERIETKFKFSFETLKIEVEETPGQSASFLWRRPRLSHLEQ